MEIRKNDKGQLDYQGETVNQYGGEKKLLQTTNNSILIIMIILINLEFWGVMILPCSGYEIASSLSCSMCRQSLSSELSGWEELLMVFLWSGVPGDDRDPAESYV